MCFKFCETLKFRIFRLSQGLSTKNIWVSSWGEIATGRARVRDKNPVKALGIAKALIRTILMV